MKRNFDRTGGTPIEGSPTSFNHAVHSLAVVLFQINTHNSFHKGCCLRVRAGVQEGDHTGRHTPVNGAKMRALRHFDSVCPPVPSLSHGAPLSLSLSLSSLSVEPVNQDL